jgi:ribosomal-protein-alanine N-acetyltransferase
VIVEFPIHLAKLADAAAIAAMSRTEIEYGLPWTWTPARVSKAISDAATNVAVIREHGVLNAFGIMKYADEVAHLHLLAVHPSRRRRGIGTALATWLEHVARVAGIFTIRVQTRSLNIPARAFYLGLGFREIANVRGMYQGMADGVRMEKTLHRFHSTD